MVKIDLDGGATLDEKVDTGDNDHKNFQDISLDLRSHRNKEDQMTEDT
jgi:hypothetical protein